MKKLGTMETDKKKMTTVSQSILKKASASWDRLKNAVAVKRTVVLSDTMGAVVTLTPAKTFASQVTKGDTIYVLKHNFDLGGEKISLPKGCVLDFQGGSISNGEIVGNHGIIRALGRIFYNVAVKGTWDCTGNVGWFASGTPIVHDQWGCRFPDLRDQSTDIQSALDSDFRELHFPPKCYYLTKTLLLTTEKKLILHGSDMKLSLENSSIAKKNTTIIFSDQDICLLRIAIAESYQNAVYIEGGNFDVSRCQDYTQNCIEVMSNEAGQRIWGLTINTNIKGRFNQLTGVGINISPIGNNSLAVNQAFVSQIRINSNVSNFGVGVRLNDYSAEHNWCSDAVVDGSIINCPVCVEADCDCDIRAMLQSGKFFAEKENGVALVKYSGLLLSMSSNIFDIRQGNSQGFSNEYALEVTRKEATATADGHFRTFCVACKRMGWPVVNGNIEL